ncbi:hypothetical protein DFH06DRAFT_1318524 [Mycena polygramma]|nr:hypothetical protein DFH06DRAFT_1318524 [Mycena polygramma]
MYAKSEQELDEHYPIDDAAASLEDIMQSRRKALKERVVTGIQHLSDLDLDNVFVVGAGNVKQDWHITTKDDSGEEQELVVRFQGVLSKADLVPSNLKRPDARKALQLSQHVQLNGMGVPSFAKGLYNVEAAHSLFSRYFVGTPMMKWSSPGGPGTIPATNRYFVWKEDDPEAIAVPFQPSTDPMGVLERLSGNQLVHTADNEVLYFKRGIDPGTQHEVYDPTFPGAFRVEDIVEVQMSLVRFSMGGKVKMFCRLQSLTLLDNRYTKIADAKREATKPPTTKLLRRKIGYADEDEQLMRAKLQAKKLRLANGEDESMT